MNKILHIDEVTISSLGEQLTKNQIQDIIVFKKKWNWVEYPLTFILLLIKVLVISFILDMGLFFFGKKISYQKLFSKVVLAEYIFVLVIVFKTIWFEFFDKDFTFSEFKFFYPFSLLNLMNQKSLQPWFVYPIQLINLFELLYVFILSYLINSDLKPLSDKSIGLKVVVSSYGLALLIWVFLVMFLILNIS